METLSIRYIRIDQKATSSPYRGERGTEDFSLEGSNVDFRPGTVHSLEGANQSGKSMLVSAVTGGFGRPHRARRLSSRTIRLEMRLGDRPVEFRSPGEAALHGVVAVYQDDELIPTATVEEQLLLRHAIRGIPGMLKFCWQKCSGAAAERIPLIGEKVREGVDRLFPIPPGTRDPKEVKAKAEALLHAFSTRSVDYRSILSKRPIDLSGGAKAIARLTSALLTPNIKFLFLDEVFRGVQADVWPPAIDRIREIAIDKEIGIVSITHNEEELVRWQPQVRYAILSQKITRIEPPGHLRLVQSIQRGGKYFPVLNGKNIDALQWRQWVRGRTLIFVDTEVVKLKPTAAVVSNVHAAAADVITIEVHGGEENKTFDTYLSLIREALKSDNAPIDTIVIIGGGVVINLCGLVAATLHRGEPSMVLVPTTLMALADVVVGGKTGVNLNQTDDDGDILRKHAIGVYHNPTSVVVYSDYIDELPITQIHCGLAEVIKHGICQDEELLSDALELLVNTAPRATDLFDRAVRTLELKAELLAVDPDEDGVSRVLQMGHLHAHAFERATGFTTPHGAAVYWGLLVDAKINGTTYGTHGLLYPVLLGHVRRTNTIMALLGEPPPADMLLSFYPGDMKRFHRDGIDGYAILACDKVGDFGNPHRFREDNSVPLKKLQSSDIRQALEVVRADLTA